MTFNNKVSTLHCTNTDLSGDTTKSLKFLTFLSLGNCKFLGTMNIHHSYNSECQALCVRTQTIRIKKGCELMKLLKILTEI